MGPLTLPAALRSRIVLGDGATGTELLRQGARLGENLALLNLARPRAVAGIHRAYVAAGAELVRTNTFAANRLRMPRRKVRKANLAGVRLARESGARWVAGSVGPLSDVRGDRRGAWREQAEALADAGCDLLFLETFPDARELREAAEVVGLPFVALSFRGFRGEVPGALATGINCVTPARALRLLGGRACAFPGTVRPPRRTAPDAFAAAIGRLAEAGARLLGGCCGTTPAHLRAAAEALRR
jgi:homocysteine S-methyltransferase